MSCCFLFAKMRDKYVSINVCLPLVCVCIEEKFDCDTFCMMGFLFFVVVVVSGPIQLTTRIHYSYCDSAL